MRRASQSDRPVIEAALHERAVLSMLPLTNFLRYGMDTDHPRGMAFWIGDGEKPDVLGVTRDGVVMPSFVGALPEGAADVLKDRRISGMIGTAVQARPLIDALGLAHLATELNTDEPQFDLSLDALHVPGGVGTLHPLDAMDRATLIEWRRDYRVQLLGTPTEVAAAQAQRDVERYIADDTHRVLMDRDTPLAMTGFNATLPGIVQIGGVYTPAALRGRGHARRALALHLAEARDHGVQRATLFASGPAAVRAYEALGFRHIGHWTLFMLAEPEMAHG